MKFLEKVKDEIKPDNSVDKLANDFIKKINDSLKKNKLKAICVKGGSTAKGTYLKNDHDIDLFVIFNHDYKGKDISEYLF